MKSVMIFLLYFLLCFGNAYSQYSYCRGDNNPCSNANLGNYTISGQKWDKLKLNYYFVNGTDDIAGNSERDAFVTAFNKWAEVVPFIFAEVFSANEADIRIEFVSSSVFSDIMGYESSAIAAAFQPERTCKGYFFLNDGYHNFSLEANPSNAKDLYTVALHEMGHILGLCHSNNSSTVMYFEHSNNKRNLHAYDIDGIRAIYDVVKVKNEFLNKNGSYSSGGIVNVEGKIIALTVYKTTKKFLFFQKALPKLFGLKSKSRMVYTEDLIPLRTMLGDGGQAILELF